MALPPDKEANPVTPPLAAQVSDDDIEVVILTPAEQRRAVQRVLNELGLTREDLREQARQGRFVSVRAQQLWMAAGGSI